MNFSTFLFHVRKIYKKKFKFVMYKCNKEGNKLLVYMSAKIVENVKYNSFIVWLTLLMSL